MSEYVTEYRVGMSGSTFERKEEIVRCRDCRHRFGCVHLLEDQNGDMRRCDVSPDGFCAWGERKEGGDD